MNLANTITITRIILIIPYFICVYLHHINLSESQESSQESIPRTIAMVLFGTIALGDALDGYVARKLNQKTRLGAILDPMADKLLMLAATTSLVFFSWNADGSSLPLYWVIPVLLRDSLITLISMILWKMKFEFSVTPILSAKLCTILHFIVISWVMIKTQWAVPELLIYPSLALTVFSGLAYLRLGKTIISNAK